MIESFDLASKVIVLMVMESVSLANKVIDFINDDEIWWRSGDLANNVIGLMPVNMSNDDGICRFALKDQEGKSPNTVMGWVIYINGDGICCQYGQHSGYFNGDGICSFDQQKQGKSTREVQAWWWWGGWQV